MSGEPVLIAALSGRALAQSARRAGFAPLVVDGFGDADTGETATASRCLPAAVSRGFRADTLIAALDDLAAGAPKAPIGLVLGSGFEHDPNLVAKLGEEFRLIGNSADVIGRVKDPAEFFAVLDHLGLAHPESRLTPPDSPAGWLVKRAGGSGGQHIAPCTAGAAPGPHRYFQRRVDGEAMSVLGAVNRLASAFAFSQQWTAPRPGRPYRYGGATGSVTLDPDLEARLIDICLAVAAEFKLVGLVSFDFLVAYGEPQLIEVNPRPGATLDVFDDTAGSLFDAHVEAALGGDPASLLEARWRPPAARASAFLYADRGPIEVGHVDWPAWSADRPRPGTRIAKHQPLATVIAEGAAADEAERLCRERLGLLEDLLYEGEKGKGTPT